MFFETLDLLKQIIMVVVNSVINTSKNVLSLAIQLFNLLNNNIANASIYELFATIALLSIALVFIVKFAVGTLRTILTIIVVGIILFLIATTYSIYLT
ncbi:MAG: hypothetical protein J7K83_02505 [Candidatus Aenigmarchaeota archaeon]|nr:hypothetical protein [Candidatus Aenigmarchaeota archaeon]